MFRIYFGDDTTYAQVNGKTIVTVETGTWTPIVYGSTTEGACTYTYTGGGRECYWIKYGNLVYLRAAFTYTITTAPEGEVRIKTAPYVSNSYYKSSGGGNTRIWDKIQIGLNANYLRPQAYNPSTYLHSFVSWGSSDAPGTWKNTVNSGDWIIFSVWYKTSS